MNEFKVKNGLIVEGLTTAVGYTSSLSTTTTDVGFFGTASWAKNTDSASWTENSVSSSYSSTSSFVVGGYQTRLITGSLIPITSSWAITSSQAITSSYVEGGYQTPIITGSLLPVTSSWAITSSYIEGGYQTPLVTGSIIPITASQAISSSYSVSSSFATNADTLDGQHASAFQTTIITGSTIPITSSWSVTSSYIEGGYQTPIITGSLIPITSSWAETSSWSQNTVSSSYADTSSFLNGFNFENTSSIIAAVSTPIVVAEEITGSYLAAFFDYAAQSSSNIRAGTIFGAWASDTASYAEYCTVDRGDTSQVTLSLRIDESKIQLVANVSTTANWNIRALVRYI